MKIFFRKLHRWLGLLMAVQIVAWMASGLYFSIFPIAEIRGEHLTAQPETLEAGQMDGLTRPEQVRASLDDHFPGGWTLASLRVVTIDKQMFWRAEGQSGGEDFTRLIESGEKGVVSRLSESEAKSKAKKLMLGDSKVTSVDWVTEFSPGSEYRGRILPVWKVGFDHPESVNLYINPWTGELLARRTDRWRIFDFLWMISTIPCCRFHPCWGSSLP